MFTKDPFYIYYLETNNRNNNNSSERTKVEQIQQLIFNNYILEKKN